MSQTLGQDVAYIGRCLDTSINLGEFQVLWADKLRDADSSPISANKGRIISYRRIVYQILHS
jgi:hypothetical protein